MGISKKPLLFVALDYDSEAEVWKIAETLSKVEGNFGFKVNLDLLVKPYRNSLLALKKTFGRPIFADLKMANGSRTMISAIQKLTKEEIDFTNIHAFMDSELRKTIEKTTESGVKILGITVLTHFNEDHCQKIYRRSFPETVRMFADISIETGCDGIILPGTTLDIVEDIDILKLVPGVRPKWYGEDKRHEQKVTPAEAIIRGADMIVVGGPITKAKDQCEVLEKILAEIKEAKV